MERDTVTVMPCGYLPRCGGGGTCSREPNGGAERATNLKERLQPCLCAAEDQRMHIVRALVGVDGLQVRNVAHDLILDLDNRKDEIAIKTHI